MRHGLVKISVIACILLTSAASPAQPQSPSSTTVAPGSLEAAIALEDPTARIAALQKFIRTNSITEQSQAAREAIVASWAQLAEVQLAENNIDKAMADLRKAVAALPENVTDQFFDATVIRMPQAVSIRGYRNEAIAVARLLEKRFSKESQKFAALGEFYMTIEAPADAIRALEAAVKLNGEAARFHRSLGAAYRTGLRLDEAIVEYQQTIKIDPNDKRAHYELANLYRAYGSYSDAVKLYRKQLEIEPKHSPSIKGMAMAFLAQGNEEDAQAALDKARELRGSAGEVAQDIYLQTQMTFYYLALGKLRQARQAADTALSIEPRYAWARIAAAEVDLAEGKYFDAERNLLAAQQYANFPTLFFTTGKLYIAVEDFEGAQEQFAKAFNYSQQKQFTTRLGGFLDVQADNLKELLSREHQAAIFLADPPTTQEQFKIAESLVRFNARLRAIKTAAPARAAKLDPLKQLEGLDQAAMDFVEAEKTRLSFRALYIAQRLAQAGVSTGMAVELADQALSLAEVATEFDGSVRDYPNYDRDGRLRIFRGRALDAKGWAQFKAGQNQESIVSLSESVRAYGPLPEAKRTLWRLATVKETAGEMREALDLYIAGYEPPSSNSSIDVNRTVIEGLYRKVNGSLDRLDQRLKRSTSAEEVRSIISGRQLAETPSTPGSAGKTAPPIAKSSGLIEPQTSQPGEKQASQFKFTIPAAPPAKDINDSSRRPSQKTKASTPTPLAVPLTDPMFAKQPANNRGSETKPLDSASDPAAPVRPIVQPISIPATPVELPNPNRYLDPSVQLSPINSYGEHFANFDNFKTSIEDEPPPLPQVHTRPRYYNTREGQANTRKRRVTVPDQ